MCFYIRIINYIKIFTYDLSPTVRTRTTVHIILTLSLHQGPQCCSGWGCSVSRCRSRSACLPRDRRRRRCCGRRWSSRASTRATPPPVDSSPNLRARELSVSFARKLYTGGRRRRVNDVCTVGGCYSFRLADWNCLNVPGVWLLWYVCRE